MFLAELRPEIHEIVCFGGELYRFLKWRLNISETPFFLKNQSKRDNYVANRCQQLFS